MPQQLSRNEEPHVSLRLTTQCPAFRYSMCVSLVTAIYGQVWSTAAIEFAVLTYTTDKRYTHSYHQKGIVPLT